MSNPAVSVVIPAYNRADSIGRAITSVRHQTFSDLEIVVVDDASTDQTRDAILAIDDPRIRLVARPVNGGASAARNTGIREAKGALIAFLDSDDAWMSDKLARQVSAMSMPGAPPVGCTGAIIHLLDHGETRIKRLGDTSDWARRLTMNCDLSPGTTQLSARAIFDEVGPLDESLPRFEDWDWLLRYTRRYPIHVTPEALVHVYNRRARLGTVVERSAELFYAKHKADFERLAPADRRQAIADLWLQVVGTYAFERNFSHLLRPMFKAAAQRPAHTAVRLVSAASKMLQVSRSQLRGS